MKRCNNCGWFNLDAVNSCEKCGEESFEPVLEDIVKPEVSQIEDDSKPAPVEEPHIEPKPAKNNHMMETVALAAPVPPSVQEPKRAFAATVMDVSSFVSESASESGAECPKCRYPIVGFVEYCPNCGATVGGKGNKATVVLNNIPNTVIETVDVPVAAAHDLKATVRDIPEEMFEDESGVFKLVPMDAVGDPVYTMREGDVITIGGKRYKFQK